MSLLIFLRATLLPLSLHVRLSLAKINLHAHLAHYSYIIKSLWRKFPSTSSGKEYKIAGRLGFLSQKLALWSPSSVRNKRISGACNFQGNSARSYSWILCPTMTGYVTAQIKSRWENRIQLEISHSRHRDKVKNSLVHKYTTLQPHLLGCPLFWQLQSV